MNFDIKNYKAIEQLYIHDSKILNISFDYYNYQLSIQMKNDFLKRHFSFDFLNVLYFDANCAEYWGRGGNILDIELIQMLDLEQIWKKLIEYNKTKQFNRERLDKNRYIAVSFVVNSGNQINIIAEKMSFEDTPIEE